MMPIAQAKLTAQGQISVPAEVRKKLGVGPGSILEWNERDGQIVVRRAGTFISSDVNAAPFGSESPATRADIKEGIRTHIRRKHAGG